jgi:hypothetical protein
MARMMSACGVRCSECPAYLGNVRGVGHQQRTEAAWKRIYGLNESAENIACGGCLAPDDQVFHTCRAGKARLCCHSKNFNPCAECPVERCPDLENAQSLWDELSDLATTLPHEDFVTYVEPYCNHRHRLAEARRSQ